MNERFPKLAPPSLVPVEPSTGVRRRPRSDDQEHYALDRSGSAFIKRYHPEYLAQGGEHFVYEIPRRPNVVVKAEKRAMFDILHEDPTSFEKETVAESPALMKAEAVLEHDREVFQTLQRIFGSEHTLWQKKFLVKVPVDGPILRTINRTFGKSEEGELFSPKELPRTDQAWTLVTIQERAEIPAKYFSPQVDARFEMTALKDALKRKDLRDQYSLFTDALTSADRTARSELSQDALLHFFFGTALEKLMEKAKNEPGLLEAMKDFAAKAVRFTEETGEIMDISGENNIVFYQKDGTWTYKVIDPVYLIQRSVVRTAQDMSERAINKKESFATLAESNALFQMSNYTRTINAMTKFAGGTEYLDFLPDSEKKHAYLNVLYPNRNFEKS